MRTRRSVGKIRAFSNHAFDPGGAALLHRRLDAENQRVARNLRANAHVGLRWFASYAVEKFCRLLDLDGSGQMSVKDRDDILEDVRPLRHYLIGLILAIRMDVLPSSRGARCATDGATPAARKAGMHSACPKCPYSTIPALLLSPAARARRAAVAVALGPDERTPTTRPSRRHVKPLRRFAGAPRDGRRRTLRRRFAGRSRQRSRRACTASVPWPSSRTRSAVARTAAQRLPAAMLDPFSLGSARKWSPKPLRKRENRAPARFREPSSGLEPETPSLPWQSG
jgi:hypothetical protein